MQYAGPLVGAGLLRTVPHVKLPNGKVAGSRRTAFSAGTKILAGKLSEARMLGRFFGLVPIISWMLSLESQASARTDSKTRNLQRMQAWSMLAYYPLEHACQHCRLTGRRNAPKPDTVFQITSLRKASSR